MNTQQAVDRLSSQLPLKARQDQLDDALRALHRFVLRALAEQGRAPSRAELADQLGGRDLDTAIAELGRADLVVLDPTGSEVVGAYPMTMESTEHQVQVQGHAIRAMCALDAVSVAPMFDTETTIDSRCRLTGTPIHVRMRGGEILEAQPAEAIVGVRWQMPEGVAAHSMCMEMVFLKDMETAREWQAGDTEYVSLFTLPEAVAFGTAFFRPLMG
jgi:mercuric reductase